MLKKEEYIYIYIEREREREREYPIPVEIDTPEDPDYSFSFPVRLGWLGSTVVFGSRRKMGVSCLGLLSGL